MSPATRDFLVWLSGTMKQQYHSSSLEEDMFNSGEKMNVGDENNPSGPSSASQRIQSLQHAQSLSAVYNPSYEQQQNMILGQMDAANDDFGEIEEDELVSSSDEER
jgi:hypothetical protein